MAQRLAWGLNIMYGHRLTAKNNKAETTHRCFIGAEVDFRDAGRNHYLERETTLPSVTL
jgi:hypothetical protein